MTLEAGAREMLPSRAMEKGKTTSFSRAGPGGPPCGDPHVVRYAVARATVARLVQGTLGAVSDLGEARRHFSGLRGRGGGEGLTRKSGLRSAL